MGGRCLWFVADGYPEPGEDEGEGLLASPTVLKTWRHR